MKLFKKLNKGFTLVELVVVIAVIAILSAVSVVAYTGITKKAKESAAIQEARALYSDVLSRDAADGLIDLFEGDPETPGNAISAQGFTVNSEKTGYDVTNYVASNEYLVTFSAGVWSAQAPAE